MPCRLVGSDSATNRRRPRFSSGITRCLCSSLSLTSLHGVEVDLDRVEVQERHAEHLRGGDRDLARLRRCSSRRGRRRGSGEPPSHRAARRPSPSRPAVHPARAFRASRYCSRCARRSSDRHGVIVHGSTTRRRCGPNIVPDSTARAMNCQIDRHTRTGGWSSARDRASQTRRSRPQKKAPLARGFPCGRPRGLPRPCGSSAAGTCQHASRHVAAVGESVAARRGWYRASPRRSRHAADPVDVAVGAEPPAAGRGSRR